MIGKSLDSCGLAISGLYNKFPYMCEFNIVLTLLLTEVVNSNLSPERYHTVWRNWHSIACSNEILTISLMHLFLNGWKNLYYEHTSERVKKRYLEESDIILVIQSYYLFITLQLYD